jgi:hypothetical protein
MGYGESEAPMLSHGTGMQHEQRDILQRVDSAAGILEDRLEKLNLLREKLKHNPELVEIMNLVRELGIG